MSRAALVLLVLAVPTHVAVVTSILRQPLAARVAPRSERSIVWSLYHDAVYRMGPGADLFAVYHAGVNLESGLNPYASHELEARTPYFYRFRYPPLVAQTLGRVLSRLSPLTAYRVWVVTLELILVALITLFWRRFSDRRWRLFSALVLLGSTPFFLELQMGQFTFAAIALAVAALLVLEHPAGAGSPGRLAFAALAFSSAVVLKLFPAVAAPALLRRRDGRAVVVIAAGIAIFGFASFVVHRDWFALFYAYNFTESLRGMHTGNFSLLYVLFLAGVDAGIEWSEESWRLVAATSSLLFLGATAIAVVWRRAPVVLGGAALLLAHMLSFAHVWEHHASGVIPLGLAVLLVSVGSGVPAARGVSMTVAVALVLVCLPTPFALFPVAGSGVDPATVWPVAGRYLLPLSKVVPTLLLFASALSLIVRR